MKRLPSFILFLNLKQCMVLFHNTFVLSLQDKSQEPIAKIGSQGLHVGKAYVHSTIKKRNEVLLATLKLHRGQGRVSNCKQSII